MSWLSRLLHRRRLESQLDKELRFHLEQHTADLIAGGCNPAEARRQARLALGGPEQVKEDCRDARGTRWIEDFFQDIRYALRTFRQRPGFAAVALLTLALGTGATTVMFSVIDGVLLKPLAYPEPGRLVSMHENFNGLAGAEASFAYLNFVDCKRDIRALSHMAAWRGGGGTISAPGDAEYVNGRQISSDLFATLGIPLLSGREFLPGEDRPGGVPVAIIGHRLWQRRFDGDPQTIGRTLTFAGKPYTIVGIAPLGFRLSAEADVYTPIGQNTAPPMRNREMRPGLRVLGRLAPGVAPARAQSELDGIARQLAEQFPKANPKLHISFKPLQQEMVGNVRPTLWLLLGAVAVVLLIACVNVASLMLARALSRERELAMRVALGAGRARLARQCLTESAVLAFCGGALGIALATIGTRPFLKFWPGSLPRSEEIAVDWRVLLFALAASLTCGLLFGLAPALRAPVSGFHRVIRAGSRTVTGTSRRMHSAFVVSEIALAVVLLVAAGLLARTLLRLSTIDPGLDPHNVLVARVALSPAALATPGATRAAWRDILQRVHNAPGVQAVAIADVLPMDGDDEMLGYWTGPSAPPANEVPLALLNLVTPDYWSAMRIPLRYGRFFDNRDRIGGEPVVVIDEVLARRAFGTDNPVGRQLNLQFFGSAKVVGVVGHVRHYGVDADDSARVREQLYASFEQLPDPFLKLTATAMHLVIRTAADPLTTVESVRREVRGATRDQAIYDSRTMDRILAFTLARQRFLLLLFGIFAGLALLLACIGIYGVLAYLTRQRVPEIGIRMALGASAGEVMAMVFRQSLWMILIGVALGVAGSVAAARLLSRLVSGVQPSEPMTFLTMIAVLIAAALLASYIPAYRASRVDPLSALRQE